MVILTNCWRPIVYQHDNETSRRCHHKDALLFYWLYFQELYQILKDSMTPSVSSREMERVILVKQFQSLSITKAHSPEESPDQEKRRYSSLSSPHLTYREGLSYTRRSKKTESLVLTSGGLGLQQLGAGPEFLAREGLGRCSESTRFQPLDQWSVTRALAFSFAEKNFHKDRKQ